MSLEKDDNLTKAIRAANETLAKIELEERNFYKIHGRHENDFLNDFISVSKKREEIVSKQLMKRFDQLIFNVNVQLGILEAKAHVAPERNLSSSATNLSSVGQSDSNQLEQIDTELMQLELLFVNIEMRIQEDVEAEEIGIEFPIADIIDYVTAIKVAMYKRHLLTNQLHRVILNDEKFKEESKFVTKDFAIWTKDEREDLIMKMTQLEESLNVLQRLPLVYGDEFNKYYPLMDDLGLLKRLVSRFLDKYELSSSAVLTARLTPSISLFQQGEINVLTSDSLKKEMSRSDKKHQVSSQGQKNQKYESDADIHTAKEKN
uniref:Syntaxin-6_N domain-containing protein n=1 Tax=Elaeophora elaphi TaxID=1147741 RepID=A0A0R3RM43_9BILA